MWQAVAFVGDPDAVTGLGRGAVVLASDESEALQTAAPSVIPAEAGTQSDEAPRLMILLPRSSQQRRSRSQKDEHEPRIPTPSVMPDSFRHPPHLATR
jgi:hypothetical protein